MVDLIVFPSSFFSISKVDEDLQAEYDAVKATGLFDIILFEYDKWFNADELVITDIPQEARIEEKQKIVEVHYGFSNY